MLRLAVVAAVVAVGVGAFLLASDSGRIDLSEIGWPFGTSEEATPVIIEREIVKQVAVEQTVVVEVPVEVVVEKQVIKTKEVPVEVVIEKQVIREVLVEVVVEKEVIVYVTPTPAPVVIALPIVTPTATPTSTPPPSTATPTPASSAVLVTGFGSVDVTIPHVTGDGAIYVRDLDIDQKNVVIEARIFNPYPRSEGTWDAGFLFRNSGVDEFHAVIITSRGVWYHYVRDEGSGTGTLVQRQSSDELNLSPVGSNHLRVIALDDEGWFFINGAFAAILDLGGWRQAGTVKGATGYFTGDAIAGKSTRFEDFTISVLRKQYGPLAGSLDHDPDRKTIKTHSSNVDLGNSVVEVQLFNPYPTSIGSWSNGVMFRRSSQSTFHAIVLTSDQRWSHRLRSGAVESTAFQEEFSETISVATGGSNHLRIIAMGDIGWLFINGEFIAQLALTRLDEPGDISAITGFFTGDEIAGEFTHFEDFTVNSIEATTLTSITATEPVVAATAVPIVGTVVAEADKFGGNLKVVAQSGIATWDVGESGAYVTNAIAYHLWEGLFMQAADFTTRPQAVDEWSLSPDGLTWTFSLRDVPFHNGTAMTSRAAINSLQRWMTQTSGRVMSSFLIGEGPLYDDAFTQIDRLTFTIDTTEPYGSLLDGLGTHGVGHSLVLTEQAGGFAFGDEIGEENYIGTNAYKFSLWEPGNRNVLERYEDYLPRSEPASWLTGGHKAYVDTITWFEIPAAETKIAGLQTGEWDFVDSIGLDFVTIMQDDPDIDITWYPGHMWYFAFNQNEPIADDINFRLAVQKAMDGEAMLASIGPPETWKLNCSIYGSGTVFESSSGCANHYNQNDIDGAKAILAQSSYAAETVTLMNPTDYSTITPVGFVIKDRMQEIGINVDMPTMDWATRISRTSGRDSVGWHMATSWGTIRNRQNPAFSFLVAAGGVAFNNYYNADMDDAHKGFLRTQDFDEQKTFADQMQLLFFQDPPQVYSGIFFMPSGYRTWVENQEPEHPAMPYYSNLWLSR